MTDLNDAPTKNELRSARTREKLLRSAITCIFKMGLQHTSAVHIAKHAGISRGAMLHHYPSKEILICDAYESLLKEEAEKLRKAAGRYANEKVGLDEFIDQLWLRFSVKSFSITLDYFTAARTDAALMKRVKQARKQYDSALEEIWCEYFADCTLSDDEVKDQLKLTINLFRGISLQMLVQHDKAESDRMIGNWKAHLKRGFPE